MPVMRIPEQVQNVMKRLEEAELTIEEHLPRE